MRLRRVQPPVLPPPRPRCGPDRLSIGAGLADGVLTLRLAGTLDRRSRPLLLRVAQRGVRAGTGDVVLDCAALASCDDCGIDALGLLPRLPGIRSVVLHHADEDLVRRLGDAGLACRLGLLAASAGASGDTASGG